MYLLPAIDLLDGKVVRLAQGDYERVTVYADDPLAQARAFEAQGATWLHVVDLNGARSGQPEHLDIIRSIVENTGLKVEVGGGIRTMKTLKAYADAGVSHMVLGTALIKDPDLVRRATQAYGNKVVAGLDARAGEVALEGWREAAGVPVAKLASELAGLGVCNMVYTDISRDGMQTGIDVDSYVRLADISGANMIASGGISTLDDLRALAASGAVWGAITGRAIYENAFDVASALAAIAETEEKPC